MEFYEWAFGASDEEMDRRDLMTASKLDLSSGRTEFSLISGEFMSSWDSGNYGIVDQSGFMMDCMMSFCFWVKLLSERMKGFMEEHAGHEIQMLPLRLKTRDGEECGLCYLLNALQLVDCLDLDRIPHKKLGRFYHPFKVERAHLYCGPYYIDRDKLPIDKRIFRIEKRPDFLIVREDLREAMESARFSGLRFVELRY